ncbi:MULTISPECIES: glycoside hydrolase family 108 protein [unclassified Chelatococcus]|uniref:glycoside hydrolase family 108 protein n=1 Tax=unclassified Chelatococcus TaxID=2638111 RepID=UPI001BD0FAE1|nr:MULTISPECIES: glycoside hydrolase family 108 protein [unclassified Chelatococcus]MBS7698473.1 glycoside hydrolase family 108 protein [Chelatococcus sp. YT9]MBX3559449.1 glycoside hydrolase family 108 protein [Chelatococcus sp.]
MVATNFQKAVDHVLASEGGYVDHPRDPGGATNLGITRATLGRFRGREVTKAEVRALGLTEATAIYRQDYWTAVQADALPGGVDFAVFDCAVNSGPRRAILLLQEALGLTRDGIIGPATLRAAATAEPVALINRYCTLRLAFLGKLPTASVFGNGWRKRVATVQGNALAMVSLGVRHPASKNEEYGSMVNLRTILLSRPIWANLVGLASIMLSLAGLDTTGLDTAGFSDALLQVVAGGSFIASSVLQLRRRNT